MDSKKVTEFAGKILGKSLAMLIRCFVAAFLVDLAIGDLIPLTFGDWARVTAAIMIFHSLFSAE